MLSRSIAREGEMAVRSALWATRLALARLTFIEALQISLLAAAVAAILAPWALRAMTLFNIGAWPEVADAKLDARTFLVLSLMALASSLLGGLVATGRGWGRFGSIEALHGRTSSPTRDRKRLASRW